MGRYAVPMQHGAAAISDGARSVGGHRSNAAIARAASHLPNVATVAMTATLAQLGASVGCGLAAVSPRS
jgi:hypothetical protein